MADVSLRKLIDNRLTRPVVAGTVKRVARRASSRALLNRLYNSLSEAQRIGFQGRFAKLFRENAGSPESGTWVVDFDGRKITLPLRSDWFWLDWDLAISILGHELEIKSTYRHLLASKAAPELFIDIGANYGTHSLLFLVAGVPTLTFEPNPACFEYFEICCEYNNVKPSRRPTALGSSVGTAHLGFAERDTWLGSVVNHAQGQKLLAVPISTLDTYMSEINGKRVLIKIDTEGAELAVLQGAQNVLRKVSPTIIFESNSGADRPAIFALLTEHGYDLAALPNTGEHVGNLSAPSFLASPVTNFIAVSAD